MELDREVLSKDLTLDPNDLVYWFPRLAKSGLRLPKTEIVRFAGDLIPLLDGLEVEGFTDLVKSVRQAVERVGGYPAFLRTGHGSGKHEWQHTCYLSGPQVVPSHISALVDWSLMVDFIGLPTQTWVVREFLNLRHDFVAFDGMPVAREFRFFLRDGQVVCVHPYWPKESIRNASLQEVEWRKSLEAISQLGKEEDEMLRQQVTKAAMQFEGFWSLDMAQLANEVGAQSWVAIDMADGDMSFHWPGCEHNPHPERDHTEAVSERPDVESMLVRYDESAV